MADKNDMGGYASWTDTDLDRRIDERIARALDALAGSYERNDTLNFAPLLRVFAAELRQPAPASEPQANGSAYFVGCTPPQPTLAEQLRKVRCVTEEEQRMVRGPAADALDAADRVREAFEDRTTEYNLVRGDLDKLRAEHEALRERYARLSNEVDRLLNVWDGGSNMRTLARVRKELADAE